MALPHIEHVVETKNKELIVILQPNGGFELDWQAIVGKMDSSQLALQEAMYTRSMNNSAEFLLFLGFSQKSAAHSESFGYLIAIAAAFVKKLSLNPDVEVLREQTVIAIEDDDVELLLQQAPFINGAEYLDQSWIEQLWEKLNASFSQTIQSYEGTVEQFFAAMNPQLQLVGRVFFHLVESKKEEYPFSFLATYAAEVSKEGKSRHLPLKNALVEYGENSRKLLELLSTVNKASESSAFIAELVESGDIFHPIGLTTEEAYTFLKEIYLYEEAGIFCRIPKWWRSRANSLKLSVSVGDKQPSRLGFDALVDFNAELFLGGESLAVSEIKHLLAEAEGLVFIKGKWVEVNHEKLKEALKAYEQAQKLMKKSDISIVDAMRFQLSSESILDVSEEACELEVTNGEWLNSVIKGLTHPETIEPVASGDDFHASLRTYQERGVSWLHFMKSLGLGACLADDMGLGKTVQVIALLNFIRTKKHEKTLLIVPASLIGNWMSEIAKFAPSLKCYVYHPSENKQIEAHDSRVLEEHDLFITTYGMLLKYTWLKDITWDSLILDEAQAIKNPNTKQTKLVKQVKASYKIAMTGTPIENRLADLWSLFDFLNKGLLGSAKEFSGFTKRLKESPDGFAKLKQVVGPFILRRLKTDKTVISDLPEKIEMKTYAALTKKQVVLYNKLVNDLRIKIESSDGIERKGLVLASLMKLKQICNHPDQYLGQGFYAEEESGKYARLREICETIYEKRERVLIFTQFKEITESLHAFLEQIFQHKGLILHGETPVKKRKELVAEFQGQAYVPFMVLSIKAGGVGLNLTSANHVIHFDRWWNPAVENQATDRAFRIGQKKNVIVHKFITKGTIEEKIDLVIEDKTKLSQEIMPDVQESWITEMDNKQLMDLFKLQE
ncbi:DEAD/DEAH box helicase [Paenibacillus eucommiae]|uniref:Non-specific serine/threonine protein kinase n=1 Tax=Paenibacillus eucommiae TaxID=1355755 RepID=A0ABS4IW15_9BACL|nr:DEAD/DEAH box helicase [Paenibacillus eucommiae]MBP1991791.1 non-specific serine/threonine protein kinase [Paenibacillus eucommiae]